MTLCRFGNTHGAKNVVAERFTDLGLQNRQMLVGRGMKYHVRSVISNNLLDGCGIADIPQHGIKHQVMEIAT